MADTNSSLPVKTFNPGDVVVKIADATIPSQQLEVEADGSINTNIRASNQDPLTTTGTALNVYITGGSSSGGIADKSTFTYGTNLETPVGGVYNDTAATLTSGTTGALRLTAERGLHTNFRNAAGTEIATAGAPLRTDPTGTTAQPVTDNGGSLTVDGTVELGATTLAALESITVQNPSGAGAVNIQDGGNSITVDGTIELGATTLAALESITVQNGAGAAAVNIQDGGNSITVDGTLAISSGTITVTNLPTTVDTNYGTVGSNTIRIASQIGNATGAANFNAGATGAQTLRVEANQGAANSTPWNIAIKQQGTPVNSYDATNATAANTTANHDYTVTAAKTLYLQRVESASSEISRIRVQIETGVGTGVYTSVDTKFNSTANPNMVAIFESPIQVAAGVKVRVAKLNRSLLLAQDLYSRICGYEI